MLKYLSFVVSFLVDIAQIKSTFSDKKKISSEIWETFSSRAIKVHCDKVLKENSINGKVAALWSCSWCKTTLIKLMGKKHENILKKKTKIYIKEFEISFDKSNKEVSDKESFNA